jgi:hypothetical protein
MKIHFTLSFIAFMFVFMTVNELKAQDNVWVNQVIVANGGRFEFNPPYIDYVTVQKYDPVSKAVTVFDTIYTQSVQDVVISGNKAFVAAQDSIIEYNLDSYQRVCAIDDSGMSRLFVYNNKLIVTKQWPVKRFYVEVLDINNNLGLLARVQNISGDCSAAVVSEKDSIYVAVPGVYPTERGKLAVIDPGSWTLKREVDFDTVAKGINDLYNYNGLIYSVNTTPDGAGNVGSITTYDPNYNAHVNHVMQVKVGKSIGTNGDLLYVKFNEGLGSYNLLQNVIADTTIIPDPGFAQHKYIIEGAVDYVNSQLYLNFGNEQSWGLGIVTTLAGDSVTSFTQGTAAEGIAIDFRTPVGVHDQVASSLTFSIQPNPVADFVNIRFNENTGSKTIRVFDMTGKTIYSENLQGDCRVRKIDCSQYPSGIYFVRMDSGQGVKTQKFIKK